MVWSTPLTDFGSKLDHRTSGISPFRQEHRESPQFPPTKDVVRNAAAVQRGSQATRDRSTPDSRDRTVRALKTVLRILRVSDQDPSPIAASACRVSDMSMQSGSQCEMPTP